MGKYAANTSHAFLQLPNSTIGTYNLHDAYNTAKLALALEAELHRTTNHAFYHRQLLPLQRAVLAMQRRGLLLDEGAKTSYRRRLRSELRDVDTYLGEVASVPGFNPNSDTQVARWLFGDRDAGGLGLRVAKRTDGGRPSVDQESLTRVLRDLRKMDEHARPVLEALFHRSRLQTIDERYLSLETGDDRRVRARVKMYGTKTYRFAYAEPALQQFPPEIRHLFTAPTGSAFVGVDYSQLEARLLAYFAMDESSIRVFTSGGDVHASNAADLLGVALGEVTKPARNFAKCLHPDTLIEMHDGTWQRAQDLKPGAWTSQGQVKVSESIGPARMLEVRTTAGHVLTVTEDHPFLTEEGWVPAKELRCEKAKGGRRGKGHKVVVLEKPSNPELAHPDEFFRLLGYLIGDGGTTAWIGFSNTDAPIVAEFNRCVEMFGGTVRQIDYKQYQVSSLGWLCDTYGLRGVKSIHKEIPQVVWRASHRQREIFLASLWETDGHTDERTCEFGSSSPKLAKGVHLMLCQMGIDGSLYHDRKRMTWKRRIAARGRVKAHFWPFVLERKRPSLPTRAREWVVQVAEIIDRGVSEAWGVQVSSGQHVTEGILTHNTFLYGISYGGAAETMKTKLFCPCPKCKDKVPPTLELTRAKLREAENRWFNRHPAVRRFQRDLADRVQKHHYYDHPFGVRRYFSKPWGPELDRELRNLPMQMGGALLMNRAQIRLHEMGAPIILQMHDAFLLEVSESAVDYWAKQVREVMEAPVPELGGVRIPVDITVGRNWGDAGPENPNGLHGYCQAP